MQDICVHNCLRSTCYVCNGTYFRDRARRHPTTNHHPTPLDHEHRSGRSGTYGTPVEQPPEGTVNIYPDSEASFRKLNEKTTHVRIIGMPLAKVVERILELAPNVKALYLGIRLELVGAKLQLRLARKGIRVVGSSR